MKLATMIASAFALAAPSVPLDPTPDEEREMARCYAAARGDELRQQADFAGCTDDEIAERIYELLVMLRPVPEESPIAPIPEREKRPVMRVALPMIDSHQTERARLEAAIAGDRGAFNALVALHEAQAFRAAQGVLRDPEAARDVVQEAFVRTWQRLGTFNVDAAFRPWLYRVVRNLAVDRLRAQQCRPAESLGDHECAPSAEDTETAFARRQAGAAIGSALDALSPDHREVIVLREVEGFSYEEIAARMECPVGTVMSRLHHARRRMHSLLRDRLGDDLAI